MWKKISTEDIPYGHSSKIHEFIKDEVTRQGHDINDPNDGGRRVGWMHGAWEYARQNADRLPTIEDVQRLGHYIEPENNHPSRFRGINVSVGTHEPPKHQDVPGRMASLMTSMPFVRACADDCGGDNKKTDYYETSGYGHPHATPDDFYLQFESIHPFADGNGRTGKILHNWLNGTLDKPKLIDDYYGGGNP